MVELVSAGTLRETLEHFAQDILTAEDTREGVSVSLERVSGFQNRATTPRALSVLIDEPEHFGGRGEAPDPAELLLAAAGASLSVTLTAHATLQDIRIDHVAMKLSATIDGVAFFQPGKGEAGLLDMRIDLVVKSPAPRGAIEALLADVLEATPVLATFRTRPKIVLQLEKSI